MKPQVVLSITLLMLTTMNVEIDDNSRSIVLEAATVSGQVSNGQIIQIEGNVQIKRTSTNVIRPKIGTKIYPGDEIIAAKGAQAIVQCNDLSTKIVQAGQNQSNGGCPNATEQKQCSPGTYKCPHRGDIAWTEGIPYIISPRRTALLNKQPILRWNAVIGAKSYTVSVEGDNVNWTKQVSDTQLVYPGEQPLQPGGRYLLTIVADTGATSMEEPVKPGGLNFSLLDATQSQLKCWYY